MKKNFPFPAACMSPFLAWGDFHARSRFAHSTIPEEKWGTVRSLWFKFILGLIFFLCFKLNYTLPYPKPKENDI